MRFVVHSAVLFAVLFGVACGRSPVDACHDAVEAENDLACVEPAAFKNAEAECASLSSSIATMQDTRVPAGVKECVQDAFCGDDKVVAYYECRADSAYCTEAGTPAFAESCDDHLGSNGASVVVEAR